MNKIIKVFIFSLAIIFTNTSIAQKTFLRNDPYKNFKIAQELFDKEKYSSAQYYFKDVINKFNNPQDEVRINAEYYFAVCALKLYHRNVETILTRFSLDHPDHPKSKNIYFQLGKHYYQTKKFKKSKKPLVVVASFPCICDQARTIFLPDPIFIIGISFPSKDS